MITWFKGGSKLSSLGKGRFRISTLKSGADWTSSISIKEFNKHDVGIFTLKIENGKAKLQSRVNVVVAKAES